MAPATATRTQPCTHNRPKFLMAWSPPCAPVNVHESKTQFSRLIDTAHAGETILVAKDDKPWARLV